MKYADSEKNIREKQVYAHISGRATAAVCIGFLSEMIGQVAGESGRQINKPKGQ